MFPQEAEDLLSQAIKGDIEFQKQFRSDETRRMIGAYKSGKNLPAFTIYYTRQNSGSWNATSYDHDAVLFAALELGVEEIPVVKVFERPYKSTGFMQGEFEFSPMELELAQRQENVMSKAGGLTVQSSDDGITHIDVADKSSLTDEERDLLDDKNIRGAILIDAVPEKYSVDDSKPWWYQ